MRFLSLLPAAAALLGTLAASGPPPYEPVPEQLGLASLFSDADYPIAALRRDEQGTVEFRLDVGKDGRVRRCTVAASSGSAALDSTTCRLVTERARFQPKRDAHGRPVRARYVSHIKWVLPAEPNG
jgi:protein TonB